MTVICEGVTSEIVPGLDDTKVPGFRPGPHGLHPVGDFQIWIPIEFLPEMMSFMMYNRGSLSVLFHPLGKTELLDHTEDVLWFGEPFPLDLSAATG